eukprot:GHVR01011231.1.p1 GENE.GHVR01011231.1~~GHVR01011231.1.p1  ORF type:complete len:220 (+),score=109.47 GHVR01011231.1:72-731(+)
MIENRVVKATRSKSIFDNEYEEIAVEVITSSSSTTSKTLFLQINDIIKDKQESCVSRSLAIQLGKRLVDLDERCAKAAVDAKLVKVLQDISRHQKNRKKSTLFLTSTSESDYTEVVNTAIKTLIAWGESQSTQKSIKTAWSVVKKEGIKPPKETVAEPVRERERVEERVDPIQEDTHTHTHTHIHTHTPELTNTNVNKSKQKQSPKKTNTHTHTHTHTS